MTWPRATFDGAPDASRRAECHAAAATDSTSREDHDSSLDATTERDVGGIQLEGTRPKLEEGIARIRDEVDVVEEDDHAMRTVKMAVSRSRPDSMGGKIPLPGRNGLSDRVRDTCDNSRHKDPSGWFGRGAPNGASPAV